MGKEPSALRRAPRRCAVAALVLSWAAALVLAGSLFLRYGSTPGDAGAAPERWPAASALHAPAGAPVVVMVAHPRCPCTRASLHELEDLLHGRAATAYVLFVVPADAEEGWERGESWGLASRIPGVVPVVDREGAEAARFGGKTSGDTFVFDERGSLAFHGGITASRGHVGDNLGLRRAVAALDHAPLDRASSPVFGCGLNDPTVAEVSP